MKDNLKKEILGFGKFQIRDLKFKVQIKDWNFQIRELIEMWKENEDNNKENFDVIKFYIIFCQLNIKTLKKIFEEKKYKLKTI